MRYLFPYLFTSCSLILSCTMDDAILLDNDENKEETEMIAPTLDPTADWMQKLITDYPGSNVCLRELSIPRSHDAGTYLLQNCTIGANACNTQTQYQNTTNQLLDGIRNFDVRPRLLNNVYFTHHMTSCNELGCNGDRVDNLLTQLKTFLDEHSELVIIEFGHFCNMNGSDASFHSMVAEIMGNRLYREVEIHPLPFIQRSLRDILPIDEGKGLAIMLYSGVSNTAENRANGVFTNSFIPRDGSYANAQNVETMKADQFAKYANFDNDGSELFEFLWTLTMDAELAIACALPGNPRSIRDMADDANSVLSSSMDELIASGDIVQGRIPNVISSDFCDEAVTQECIRISLLNME